MVDENRRLENCIWLVRGHKDPANTRGWRSFEASPDTHEMPDDQISAVRKTKAGLFLSASEFPKDNYPRPSSQLSAHLQPIPQLFSSGFFFLKGESAELLRRFDMGEGALYPTRLWYPDRKTTIPGDFYYLSQGNKKDGFLVQKSPDAKAFGKSRWTLPPIFDDDQLVFSESVLSGPDIWWDKSIATYFFISNRLAAALREAGLAEDWHLLRCPVITGV